MTQGLTRRRTRWRCMSLFVAATCAVALTPVLAAPTLKELDPVPMVTVPGGTFLMGSENPKGRADESIAAHPITMLKNLRFRVTVNTDNRLMSGTSMTREMQLLVDEAGWTIEDLRWATINAMKSAFLPFDERLEIIEHVVKPGYAALGARA